MTTLKLFEVTRHDGMGGSTPVAKFDDANDAQAVASRYDGTVHDVTVTYYTSVEDFDRSQEADAAKRARAKLSPSEFEALQKEFRIRHGR